MSLWIQGTPYGLKIYYPETNSLVFVHQREYHVCFLRVSATSPRLSTINKFFLLHFVLGLLDLISNILFFPFIFITF